MLWKELKKRYESYFYGKRVTLVSISQMSCQLMKTYYDEHEQLTRDAQESQGCQIAK